MKTHYESLGVDESVSKEEIKKAYRKLCMETHPDIVKCPKSKAANTEKFRQISEAHRILSDDKARRRYNYEIEQARIFGRPLHTDNPRANNGFHHMDPRAYGDGRYSRRMSFLDGIYKPRNLLLGLTIGFMSVSLIKSQFGDSEKHSEKRSGVAKKVEAWKNPRTGFWEQPAPWDPFYQKLKPKLVMVPREQVRPSHK